MPQPPLRPALQQELGHGLAARDQRPQERLEPRQQVVLREAHEVVDDDGVGGVARAHVGAVVDEERAVQRPPEAPQVLHVVRHREPAEVAVDGVADGVLGVEVPHGGAGVLLLPRRPQHQLRVRGQGLDQAGGVRPDDGVQDVPPVREAERNDLRATGMQ